MTLAPRFLVNLWAGLVTARFVRRLRVAGAAVAEQRTAFRSLVDRVAATAYGREHGIGAGMDYPAFRDRVPARPSAAFVPMRSA